MKFKSLAVALAAALIGGAAAASTLDPVFVTPTNGSFSDVVLGSFTLTQASDVTGSVFAATSIDFGSGFTLPLQSVSFSFAGLNGTGLAVTDLDTSAGGFRYANLAAGTYQLIASGTLGGTGFGNVAVLSTTVNAVAAAVPEPATYALMLAGIGALGVAARRRRA